MAVLGMVPPKLHDLLMTSGIRVVAASTPQGSADGIRVPDDAAVVVYGVDSRDGRPALDIVTGIAGRVPTLLLAPGSWRYARAALEGGVAGYFVCERGQAALEMVVAAVHGCQPVADCCGADASATTDEIYRLSPREREVLLYIAQGYTHGQTATRMGVKKTTVDTFVARIRAKCGLGNKAELTRVALSLLGTALPAYDHRRGWV